MAGAFFMFDLPAYLTDPNSVQVKYRPIAQLKQLPPVPEPGDTTSPAALFWRREHRRSFFDGWTAEDGTYFNPMSYWIWNHTQIEQVDGDTGIAYTSHPLYSVTMHEMLNEVWDCRAQGISALESKKNKKKAGKEATLEDYASTLINAKDMIFTKGRRKGFSFGFLAGILPWKFCVEQNGHLGAGFDSADSRVEGQRVFRMVYDNLHPFWKHPKSEMYKDGLYVDREGMLSSTRISEDGSGIKQGNIVVFKEMDKRTGAFRGKNFNMIFFDEAGKYTNLQKMIGASVDCLGRGIRKYGSMIIGGTCDPITNANKDYEDLWTKGEELGWRTIFIPAWQLAEGLVDYMTGENQEELARQHYRQKRQKLIDAGAMSLFYIEVQENPLEREELFMLPTLSSYPSEKLTAQTLAIASQGKQQRYTIGRIEWELNSKSRPTGVARFVADPNGHWAFLKSYEVRKDLIDLDVAGVDDVMKDVVTSSDSKCAIVLYRRFHHRLEESDLPAAVYLHRPMLDEFADEVYKLMALTGCRTILEHNMPVVSNYLREKGMGEKLLWFNGEPGLRNSEQSIAQQTMLTLRWIREGGLGRVWFQSIIDALKVWKSTSRANTDIGSAFHLCMMGVDKLNSQAIEDDEEMVESIPLFGRGLSSYPVSDTESDDYIPLFGNAQRLLA